MEKRRCKRQFDAHVASRPLTERRFSSSRVCDVTKVSTPSQLNDQVFVRGTRKFTKPKVPLEKFTC